MRGEAGVADASAPTSPSAAPSTRSSTAKRSGCRSTLPHLPELRRVGMEIKHAIEAAQTIAHPLEPGLHGIYGTIFTGPPSDDTRRPAQRHDLRRRGSRPIAVRHRHGRGDGGDRRDGPARRRPAVRARKPDRHAVHRPRRVAHRGRRVSRRSCPKSRAPRGSPASTRFSSMQTDPLREGFRIL